MQSAIPYVVIGVFLTVGIALAIAGCATGKNWYPLFVLIPIAIAILCQYGIIVTTDGMHDGGWITADGWIFCQSICLLSCVALPLTLYHCEVIGGLGLGLNLAGIVVIIIGYIIFHILCKKSEY